MNRRAIAPLLDILWFGYWAGLLAAAGAVVGCLLNPAWNVPFAALGSPPLVLLALLALRRRLMPGQPDPAPVDWIRRAPAWIWVAAYAVLLAALAIRKHAALESHGSDLGIFVNLFWNLTHGNGWYNGMLERNFMGEHFSPLLILIAPLYRFWPAPECLLVVQSAALAVGAWPIYQLARFRLGHGAGLVAMYAYFVYPPLLGTALHDFHEVALAVPLLGFAIWWLSQGRIGLSVLALAAAVLCKEELALTAATFGIYLAIVRRDWKTGGALFAAGLAVFLLLVGAVLPAFRGGPLPFADRYSQFSGGLGEILAQAKQDPAWLWAACWSAAKGRYLLDLLRPLGFLPLLAPLECLPALPTLARNLLSNHQPQFEIYFHYPAPLIPFFFAAAVAGIGRLRDGMLRMVPAAPRAPGTHWAAVGWLALAATLWGVSLPRRMERFVPDARAVAFHELRAQIPADASVSAHNRLVPHVANRRDVCTFPVVRAADYVLLDFGYPDFEYPVHAETHRQKFLRLLADGEYRVFDAREKFVLLRRQPGAASAFFPEVLDDLFFRYRREHLRRIKGKHDVYWQGAPWFFPPGRWRATVTVESRGSWPAGSPVVFSIHPYLGGRMGEWSLGDRAVDAVPAADSGRPTEHSFSWEFEQPRRQMLSLRILHDPRERLRLKALEFHPADASATRAGLLSPGLSSILGNVK
ncbi:MAG: DUF2079 domain-containing protein [Kiritimatiellia bacterium]